MKFATVVASIAGFLAVPAATVPAADIAAAPISIAALLNLDNTPAQVNASLGPLATAAAKFAKDADAIAAGGNFRSGPLYDVAFDLMAMTTYSLDALFLSSWFNADNNFSEEEQLRGSPVWPTLVSIDSGLSSLLEKAPLVPVNNSTVPFLLAVFQTSLGNLLIALGNVLPGEKAWLDKQANTLNNGFQVVTNALEASTATAPLADRSVSEAEHADHATRSISESEYAEYADHTTNIKRTLSQADYAEYADYASKTKRGLYGTPQFCASRGLGCVFVQAQPGACICL